MKPEVIEDYKKRMKEQREKWGPGPWSFESDRVDFHYLGYDCLLLRNHMGVWCGYVGVPKGHVYYGLDYSVPDVSVHGGLTYSGACEGNICHITPGGDVVWWFGFDCGHYLDHIPGMAAILKNSLTNSDGVYRDQHYVSGEVIRLATQLREANTWLMRLKMTLARVMEKFQSLKTTLFN